MTIPKKGSEEERWERMLSLGLAAMSTVKKTGNASVKPKFYINTVGPG